MSADAPANPDLFSLRAATADEMKALGRRLGAVLRAGDVVGLAGPLGAGKTTFVQGLAVGIEVPADRHVASPTFALVNEHPGRVRLVHADLYRVRTAAELAELGLDDIFDRAAVVIEWIDLFPAAAPKDFLRVTLTVREDGAREVRMEATGAGAERVIEGLATSLR